MKFLLEEQMGELHKWFDRLYGPRGHKLEIFTKHNMKDKREEYILDLHIHRGPSYSYPTKVPFDYLDDLQARVAIKEAAMPRWQKAIMDAIR